MRSKLVIAGLCVVLVLFAGMWSLRSARVDSSGNTSVPALRPPSATIVTQAVLIRALSIEAPWMLSARINSFPTSGLTHDDRSNLARTRANIELWAPFFRGAVLKLMATHEAVLFYNPFTDVAVMEHCYAGDAGAPPNCNHLCAFPAGVLDHGPLSRAPPWIRSGIPLEAYSRSVTDRLTSISNASSDSIEQGVAVKALAGTEQFCRPDWQRAAEVRTLDATQQLARLNVAHITRAVSQYLNTAATKRAAQQSETEKRVPLSPSDAVLPLLTHLDDFTLIGAVALPDRRGWLVFLAANRTAWKQAVLMLKSGHRDELKLESAKWINLGDKGPTS
jgi:hypothetical protein